MKLTKKTLAITAILVYLLTTGVSYVAFASFLPGDSPGRANRLAGLISPLTPGAGEGRVNVDESAPKTEECPINGEMYTQAEREAWEQRTPIAVMIENHPEARPQSGLTNADVVYEAIAEGGITRFMAMMYCDAQAQDVILAPVRSARTYFIDWASGYQKPLYVHVGGANLPGPANALGQLSDYGWVGENDLNQFSIGFPTFARNYNRVELASSKRLATEHTMETSTERIWDYAAESRDITTWEGVTEFDSWLFQDDASMEERGSIASIAYDFWSGYSDFRVNWTYDAQTNSYKRNLAGEPHIDLNNNEQIAVKNVVILKTDEEGPIDELKHMLYETTGTGEVLIFQNGKVLEATWRKPTRTSRIAFTAGGNSVEFVRGQVWISVLDTSSEVDY